ncbi:MAG: alpha-mannosidase [Candidatus Methylacidiphilales bacterium]|nr:glycoside hydrolase family 38 C-terminal domain-containing protein [Candidatus Methylacidiphilales bacterium]
MLKHPDYTRDRIRQLVSRIAKKIYEDHVPVTSLSVAGPGMDRISHAEALKIPDADFEPARIGDQYRPAWATYWFRVAVEVPQAWAGHRVDFLWDSQSEATLWVDGISVQGLNMTQGDRPDAILFRKASGGEKKQFLVEMACNNKFGLVGPQDAAISTWHLRECKIARFNPEAWDLYWDAYVLSKLLEELMRVGEATDLSWSGLLLSELNRFCNILDLKDTATWAPAREILKGLYEYKNPSRAFELSVIGHAHIDTAWLWPLAETHRKCERSFSTAVAYMQDYPEYKFSCSQAYQYEIIAKRNPVLYAKIKERIQTGQWVPVGGTWIEPDCNIPSGEALVRQFVYGQAYFKKEFGKRCNEFWNPDVFGYNGQLPQIMRLSGINRFLTQKLSWNRFNKPHNHTFLWRGIDGSEVLTHFPPSDTYNAFGTGESKSEIQWLRQNLKDFRDHDRGHEGIMLYGWGDGGGGPTKGMLEVIRRSADIQGLPRTVQRTSDEFFERLEKDVTDPAVIFGELYFEYHRGTYTSQAAVKRNNRMGEQLLHELEFLATAAAVQNAAPYPAQELSDMWKVLLLNQFHDILPGSSITEVYEDSAKQFETILAQAQRLIADTIGKGSLPYNTIGVTRAEVVELDGKLAFAEAPAYGLGEIGNSSDNVMFTREGDLLTLENSLIRAVLTTGGRLVSLVLKSNISTNATGRETMAAEGNVFEIYDDVPTAYDAWDVDPYHLETKKVLPAAHSWEIAATSPLRADLRFTYKLSNQSTLVQTVRLNAEAPRLEFHCNVEWRESQKMLKVAFPVRVLARDATYEMQFGHVDRPTHYSTMYDLAKYEVPMHRWFNLQEHGFGIAILNNNKYGGSTFDNVMRLSLLRSPKHPDPQCDMGAHSFSYALMPHAGDWRDAGVVEEALRFNYPIRFGGALKDAEGAEINFPRSFVSVENDTAAANVVLDTVKRAESSDAIILRLYESHGGRGVARVRLSPLLVRRVNKAEFTNVLEDAGNVVEIDDEGSIEVPYNPHQIITIKLS